MTKYRLDDDIIDLSIHKNALVNSSEDMDIEDLRIMLAHAQQMPKAFISALNREIEKVQLLPNLTENEIAFLIKLGIYSSMVSFLTFKEKEMRDEAFAMLQDVALLAALKHDFTQKPNEQND